MRNLLALLGLALVVVGGLGWYLGWYKVKTEPAADPGHHNVSIDIDTNKIGKDLHNGEQKLQKILENSKADPSKPGKEQPGKSGSVLPMPEVSGFPFDAPTPQSGGANYCVPSVLKPATDSAPVTGNILLPPR
jgi:hypothetical protein